MKAVVNQNTCIGCGLCVGICPDVFSMDSDTKAIAISGPVPAQLEDDVVSAKDGCPVEAISI